MTEIGGMASCSSAILDHRSRRDIHQLDPLERQAQEAGTYQLEAYRIVGGQECVAAQGLASHGPVALA